MAKLRAYYGIPQDEILSKTFNGDYSCYNCGRIDKPIFVLKGPSDGTWFACEACTDSYAWKAYLKFQWIPTLTILGEVYG